MLFHESSLGIAQIRFGRASYRELGLPDLTEFRRAILIRSCDASYVQSQESSGGEADQSSLLDTVLAAGAHWSFLVAGSF